MVAIMTATLKIIYIKKDIAEHLNKHFCNITKTTEIPSKHTFQYYLKNPILYL